MTFIIHKRLLTFKMCPPSFVMSPLCGIYVWILVPISGWLISISRYLLFTGCLVCQSAKATDQMSRS